MTLRIEVARPDGSRSIVEFRNGEASIVLPAWAGHKLVERDGRSDGSVQLHLPAGDVSRVDEAIGWLLRHDAELRSLVLHAVAAKYPALQDQYGYSGEEKRQFMPDIERAEDLCELIELRNVHLRDEGGTLGEGGAWPTLGFEMECIWDPEHGCGALLRGLNVDEVGGADAAFG